MGTEQETQEQSRETRNPPHREGFPGYSRRSKPDARTTHGRDSSSLRQPAAARLLGPARLSTYLVAAGGDPGRAVDLALWSTRLSGALHTQITFVEIALRNAVDEQLSSWSLNSTGVRQWTTPGGTVEPVYSLLRRQLNEARTRATREFSDRHRDGAAARRVVEHDDVVAQLMFGSWVRLIRPVSRSESAHRQQELWKLVLHRAFPNAGSEDDSRAAIGDQLETIRRLRNRVAHHDNLLDVDARRRLNGMLALLADMDVEFPSLAMARSNVREVIKEDPRRAWRRAG